MEKTSTIYRYISLNHRKDFFKKREVRQALSLLIPRRELLKYKVKGTAELSFGLLSKAFTGQYHETPIDHYDLAQANRLLDLAGFPRNEQGVRFKLDWKSTNNRSILEIVEIIKHYFAQAGIVVHITTLEWGTFMKSIKSGNYDIHTGQWIGFTGPDMLRHLFHSESLPPKGANRGHYINSRLDHLLDLAANEVDAERRNHYYRDAQKVVARDYPYINLWHPKVNWPIRSCVSIGPLYSNGSFLALLTLRKSCHKI